MSIKPSGLKIKIGIGISIPCFPIHPAKAGLHFALRQTQWNIYCDRYIIHVLHLVHLVPWFLSWTSLHFLCCWLLQFLLREPWHWTPDSTGCYSDSHLHHHSGLWWSESHCKKNGYATLQAKELGPRTAKLALFHVKIVKHEIV